MDIRGADRKVADLMFHEPYQGDLYDERFHGFGRTVLAGGEEYVGSFEHGRRHGHGTAVWPDGLKYIGEWQHNTATGVGCLSWPGGALYVGDIRRGQRHGRGIFKIDDTKYIGEWHEGKRHGWGTQISPDLTYSGNWVDGHRHGWGTVEFASLNRYSGEWETDRMNGFGTMLWVQQANPTAEAAAKETYRRSQRDLLAKLRSQITNVGSVAPGPLGPFTPAVPSSTDALEQYSGEWKDNKPNGKGDYTLMFHSHTSNRDVPFEAVNHFSGRFVEGKRHGPGEQHFADGTTYVGTWAGNLKEGPGIIYYPDGNTEEVVMKHDSPSENPPRQPRGGHGVGALIKIDDLFDGLEAAEVESLRNDLSATLARSSNVLHHLFNVYSVVASPLEYHDVEEHVLNPPPPPPGPEFQKYISEAALRIRPGCGALERNATITAAITGKVVAMTAATAKAAFEIMKKCSADFEIAQSAEWFTSPTHGPQRTSEFAGSMSPLKSPLSDASRASARRPATPSIDVAAAPTSLEAMLPEGLRNQHDENQPGDVRLSLGRLHALLTDALLIDLHFPFRRVTEALTPLMERLARKPSKEKTLSYPSFVEAVVRIAHAKVLMSYPFFTAAAKGSTDLRGALQYVLREFFAPLCGALRDLDYCGEFTRLGVDRYVFEASENGTVDDIRKSAIRILRDKARLSKMKGDSPEVLTSTTGPTVVEPLAMTVAELNTTMRLGDTIAHLANEPSAAATLRRIERPTSASIDALESMDLPSGATNEKISAQIRHKHFFHADAPTNTPTNILNVSNASTGSSSSKPTPQLEVWYVVVNIRHANMIHNRLHAVVVQSNNGNSIEAKKQLVGVIPNAALHRVTLTLGLQLPSELRQFLAGGEGPHSNSAAWAIVPPMPLMANHMSRFPPIALVMERCMPTFVRLYKHARHSLWNLIDFCLQLGLLGHFHEFAPRPPKTRSRAKTDLDEAAQPIVPIVAAPARQPVDIVLRNVMFTALGVLVDDVCSTVTAVSDCPVPPVYDQQLLRAFLKKTPELAAALQINAIHEDARRDRLQQFRNLKTAVGVRHWWSVATSIELSIEEFAAVVVQLAYYIYLAPVWTKATARQSFVTAAEEKAEADPFAAAETSSTMSGATSFAGRLRVAPAATMTMGSGLVAAVETFSASWPLMLNLPRRVEAIHPGSRYDPSFEQLALQAQRLERPRKRAPPPKPKQVIVAAPVAPTHGKKKDTAPDHGHAKPAGNNAPPPPPPPTATQLTIRNVRGTLAEVLAVPDNSARDVPPISLDKPLPVRPRSTPVEDPKKKKPAAKKA